MSYEKYSNSPQARRFLEIQGFKQIPGKWYAFYHSNGIKAAITPINRGVMVIYSSR